MNQILFIFLFLTRIIYSVAGPSQRAKCALECFARCMQSGTPSAVYCNCPTERSFRSCSSVEQRLLKAEIMAPPNMAETEYVDSHTIRIQMPELPTAYAYVFEYSLISTQPNDWFFAGASVNPSITFPVLDPCRDYQFRVIALVRAAAPEDQFVVFRPRAIPVQLPPFVIQQNQIYVEAPVVNATAETVKIYVRWALPRGYTDADVYGYEAPAIYPIECRAPEDELPQPKIEIIKGGGRLAIALPSAVLEARCRLWVEVRMLPRCVRLEPYSIQKNIEVDCERNPELEICNRDANPMCTDAISVGGSRGKAIVSWHPPEGKRQPLYYHVRYGPAKMEGTAPFLSWQLSSKRDVKVEGTLMSLPIDIPPGHDYGIQVCAILTSHRTRPKFGVVRVTPFHCVLCHRNDPESDCGHCKRIAAQKEQMQSWTNSSTDSSSSAELSSESMAQSASGESLRDKSSSSTVYRMETDLLISENRKNHSSAKAIPQLATDQAIDLEKAKKINLENGAKRVRTKGSKVFNVDAELIETSDFKSSPPVPIPERPPRYEPSKKKAEPKELSESQSIEDAAREAEDEDMLITGDHVVVDAEDNLDMESKEKLGTTSSPKEDEKELSDDAFAEVVDAKKKSKKAKKSKPNKTSVTTSTTEPTTTENEGSLDIGPISREDPEAVRIVEVGVNMKHTKAPAPSSASESWPSVEIIESSDSTTSSSTTEVTTLSTTEEATTSEASTTEQTVETTTTTEETTTESSTPVPTSESTKQTSLPSEPTSESLVQHEVDLHIPQLEQEQLVVVRKPEAATQSEGQFDRIMTNANSRSNEENFGSKESDIRLHEKSKKCPLHNGIVCQFGCQTRMTCRCPPESHTLSQTGACVFKMFKAATCLPKQEVNATWDPESMNILVRSRGAGEHLRGTEGVDRLFIEFGKIRPEDTISDGTQSVGFVFEDRPRMKMVVATEKLIRLAIFSIEPFIFHANESLDIHNALFGMRLCAFNSSMIMNPYIHDWDSEGPNRDSRTIAQIAQLSPIHFINNLPIGRSSTETYWSILLSIGKFGVLAILGVIMCILIYLNCAKIKALYDRRRTRYFRPYYVDPQLQVQIAAIGRYPTAIATPQHSNNNSNQGGPAGYYDSRSRMI